MSDGGGHGWYERVFEPSRPKRPTIGAIINILENDPRIAGTFALNERVGAVVFASDPVWRPGAFQKRITDDDVTRCVQWLEESYKVPFPWDLVFKAISAVAARAAFDPVRVYLEALTWDGKLRIHEWLHLCLGAEQNPWTQAVGRAWLVSAVARTFKPGCKADHVLVLEGPQGLGKSTALQILAGEWFTDDVPDLHSKDAALQTGSAWIVELAELAATKRSDQESIKAFLTRTVDRYRPSYGRNVVERPRRQVFAASTNSAAWLHDETGGRRFWPVAVGAARRTRLDLLEKYRDHLWAEAVVAFRNGEAWHLTDKALLSTAQEQQEQRRVDDPWLEVVAKHIDGRRQTSVADVFDALEMDVSRATRSDAMRVSAVLVALGWKRRQLRSNDGRSWVYVPADQVSKPVTNPTAVTNLSPTLSPTSVTTLSPTVTNLFPDLSAESEG